jgi:hypothetical protein
LARVVTTTGLFIVFVTLFLLNFDRFLVAREATVRIRENLLNFSKRERAQPNMFTAFLRSGSDRVGIINRDLHIIEDITDSEQFICRGIPAFKSDEQQLGKEAIRLKDPWSVPRRWVRVNERVWRAIPDRPGQPDGYLRHCLASGKSQAMTSEDVVAYDFTALAYIERALKAFVFSIVPPFALYALLANVYYRGFVYVLYGSAKSRQRKVNDTTV